MLTLDGAAYRLHGEFPPGTTATSVLLPTFTVDVTAVFDAGRGAVLALKGIRSGHSGSESAGTSTVPGKRGKAPKYRGFIGRRVDHQKAPGGPIRRTARFRLSPRGLLAAKIRKVLLPSRVSCLVLGYGILP